MVHLKFRNIEQIVIRSANWVGDAIMSTPAIRAIRHNFPSARITLLAKPWVVPVFDNSPDIDDIMVYQEKSRHHGWTGLLRLAGDLRRGRFDLAILFQNAFEAALLAYLAGIPNRMGFTTDGRTALLTERIRTWKPLKDGHLVDYYLGLLHGAGLVLCGRQLTLVVSRAEKMNANKFIDEIGGKGRLVAGLSPGATFGTAKRWLPERFAELGKRLSIEHNARILIFGGPNEADLGHWLATAIGNGAVNLSGRTSLRQAISVIGECDLFVTNDSGLMHVAAALDIPQVAVIGPTNPVETGPINAHSRIVHLPESCEFSPCMQPHCPIRDHRCMNAITVERVLRAARTLIS